MRHHHPHPALRALGIQCWQAMPTQEVWGGAHEPTFSISVSRFFHTGGLESHFRKPRGGRNGERSTGCDLAPGAIGKVFLSATASGSQRKEQGHTRCRGTSDSQVQLQFGARVTHGKGTRNTAPDVGSSVGFQCLCSIFFVAITTNKKAQLDLLCFSERPEVQKLPESPILTELRLDFPRQSCTPPVAEVHSPWWISSWWRQVKVGTFALSLDQP